MAWTISPSSAVLSTYPRAYGLIIAYTIVAARPEDPRRNAVAVLRASGLLFGLALVAWSLRQFGTAEVTASDNTPLGLCVVDTTLGLVTIMALETLVIGLMPIRFLHGHKLWAWNRYAWLAVYVAAAALVTVVLSGPSKRGDGDILTVLWLFAGFCAGSFAFWAVFAIRDVRHRRLVRA